MAIGGLRPVAEIMTVNFSLLAMDQIINQLAKIRYMSGGKITLPVVVRMPQGVAKQLAAQHSQSLERLFASVPGLRVFVASDATTAYYGLKFAVSIDDPVIFLEHAYRARIKREGDGITIVSYLKMLHDTMKAVSTVEEELGVSCEIIDLCSINPLDISTISNSVKKTKHLVVVTEEPRTGAYALDAPPLKICGEDVPTPYNRKLELMSIPTPEKIATEIIKWGKKHGI